MDESIRGLRPSLGEASRASYLRLETPRTVLGLPGPDAAARMVDYLVRNQAHHAPWDPPRPPGFLTLPFWQERLPAQLRELNEGRALRLVVFRRGAEDGPVLGQVNFTNFQRGPFQACQLGYSLDEGAVGQGLMSEALGAAIAHIFGPLGLHRIMANYLPTNERSGRLLRRLGFTVDGFARDYLYIDGAWRDHILTALTNPTPQPPKL